MTNREAIEVIKLAQAQVEWEYPMDYAAAFDMAISALQAQEAKTQLSREDTTLGVQKTCVTCKHYPESKWPCIDCDMRNPADRWEPQELSKNSTELDKENGELHPTCTGSEELKQEVKNSTESSLTQKALDTIKPMRVIDANKLLRDIEKYHLSDGKFQHWVQIQPTIEPETCEDAVSRNAIIQKLNTMDRYVSEELILCDTDKKFPKNEVFIVDDVYEEIVEKLPSAQPAPCEFCKHNNIVDDKACLMCSAERRTDE